MADGEGSAERDAVAARFVALADGDFAGYSPVYERVARAIADDDAALDVVTGLAPAGRAPVLALAAVHDLVLAEPSSELARHYRGEQEGDPWPAFRRLLLDRGDEVAHRMRTRSIQTNEVGRAAVLVPALAAVVDLVADGRPLALVEVGPSAGLNLFLDAFSITYVDGDGRTVERTGPTGSPVQLRCEVRGPLLPPIPGRGLDVVERTGIDLSPVDVTDDEACRWLLACLWPGVEDRRARLLAAIEVARRHPPVLRVGDASTDLGPLLAELAPDVVPVVVATWALAYLDRPGRAAVAAAVDEVGRTRDVALVTAETPRAAPWVPELPADVVALGAADGDGTGTVLGMRAWHAGRDDTRALGLSHPHGRWLAWADAASAGGERP